MLLALVGHLIWWHPAGSSPARMVRFAWRQKSLSRRKLNAERLQLGLSLLQLILLVFECYYHIKLDQP
jgi:hypothetical protein